MIRGSQLIGRPVIDMEAAERLGKIKEVIVRHDGERIAGFVVSHGETIMGTGGTRRLIPASALHAIGPDAITVRASALQEKAGGELDSLPRMSDVIGHKMMTRSGRLLGSINDVLIDGANGSIIGFAIGEGVRNKLENLFNQERAHVRGYVRANADLQVGNDLVVVPDDALIEGDPTQKKEEPPRTSADERPVPGWANEPGAPPEAERASDAPRRSIWGKNVRASAPVGSVETDVEKPAPPITEERPPVPPM